MSKPVQSSAPQPDASLSRTLYSGLQQTTRQIEKLHGAVAATGFGLLRRLPLLDKPAQLAEAIHGTVAGGVFAALRQGGGALLEVAEVIEDVARAPGSTVNRGTGALRAALNAVAGDELATRGNPLAIAMGLYADGQRLELDGASLAAALPGATGEIVVFVHGFACDEKVWLQRGNAAAGESAQPFGERLAVELGVTPLYLRFNSGLPIADNGRAFGELLETLVAFWPLPSPQLTLIGHSAGGLLARCACEAVDDAGVWPRWSWQRQTRMLICLATPHSGAPMEKMADLATQAMALSPLTASLGRSAVQRREQIEALRRELSGTQAATRGIAYRLLGASLAEDVEHPLGELIGDGVVTLSGATAHPASGDVDSRRLGGVGHLGLLADERVYRQIREWMGAVLK